MTCERYSSMDKLLRIATYFLHFLFNLRTKVKKNNDHRHGDISSEEIFCSKTLWIK